MKPLHIARKKLAKTIDSCITIEQLQSAAAMAANFIALYRYTKDDLLEIVRKKKKEIIEIENIHLNELKKHFSKKIIFNS